MKPNRDDDNYWSLDCEQHPIVFKFNHFEYEMDLENYISELENNKKINAYAIFISALFIGCAVSFALLVLLG
jgi:hypothetical protein